MIKLTDGELIDLLPASMKSDTDMACLSYAINFDVFDCNGKVVTGQMILSTVR